MSSVFDSLVCSVRGHAPSDGGVRFDIPCRPYMIDDEYMYRGSVCLRRTECARCGKFLDSELEPVTAEAVEEYNDWFERRHGVRPPNNVSA